MYVGDENMHICFYLGVCISIDLLEFVAAVAAAVVVKQSCHVSSKRNGDDGNCVG